jgi:hypothetical protein
MFIKYTLEKTEGVIKMENPEIQATFGTQDIGQTLDSN